MNGRYNLRERVCGRKVRFADKTFAKKRAEELTVINGCQMRAYPCVFCFQYHLTHKPGKSFLGGDE